MNDPWGDWMLDTDHPSHPRYQEAQQRRHQEAESDRRHRAWLAQRDRRQDESTVSWLRVQMAVRG